MQLVPLPLAETYAKFCACDGDIGRNAAAAAMTKTSFIILIIGIKAGLSAS